MAKTVGQRIKSWGITLLLAVLVFSALSAWKSKDMLLGPAPVLAGYDLQGQLMTLEPKDEPTLIYFWATWCPICGFTISSIASIAEDYPVITVATTSGSEEEIKAYLAQKSIRLPVMMDDSGDLGRHWNVTGVPAIFIVDSKGQITHRSLGYASELGLRARLALAD
jgi:thiol-disulfide isomerase/thioredoxin